MYFLRISFRWHKDSKDAAALGAQRTIKAVGTVGNSKLLFSLI